MPDIRTRVQADITRLEGGFWVALSSANPGEALDEMLAKDCVLNFPNSPMLANDTKPSLKEIINDKNAFKRWDKYGFDDFRVIVIDLMAAVAVYRLQADRGGKIYKALCATTWRQDSDGEWRIVCHAQTPSNY